MPLGQQKQLELQELTERLCDTCDGADRDGPDFGDTFSGGLNFDNTDFDNTDPGRSSLASLATSDDIQRLNDLLLNDPDAQRYYLHRIDMINELRWQLTGEATHRSIAHLKTKAEYQAAYQADDQHELQPETQLELLPSLVVEPISNSSAVTSTATKTLQKQRIKRASTHDILAHARELWQNWTMPRWPLAVAAGCALAATLAIVVWMSLYREAPNTIGNPSVAGIGQAGTPGNTPANDNVQPTTPTVIAAVNHIAGNVTVTTPDGRIRNLASDPSILSGDTITTAAGQSATLLTFKDDTQLVLGQSSAVHFKQVNAKHLNLKQGSIEASVRPQPTGRPMRIDTPNAQVQVVGTQFTIDVSNGHTDLSVTEGIVKVQRTSDGQWLDVPAGKRVIIDNQQQLETTDIVPATGTWSQRFKNTTSNTTNNAAANQIQSRSNWSNGLFTVNDDSHLHITFKANQPGLIRTFIHTRAINNQPLASFYVFDRLITTNPNRTYTAVIPLSAFKSTANRSAALNASQLPVQISLLGPDKNLGLTIQKLSVTRGGPGQFELREN